MSGQIQSSGFVESVTFFRNLHLNSQTSCHSFPLVSHLANFMNLCVLILLCTIISLSSFQCWGGMCNILDLADGIIMVPFWFDLISTVFSENSKIDLE